MIDPQERWAQYGEKPDYLGLLTFSGTVYTEDPAELEGFEVAIVGAPMDDLVSDRPGARLAPRAIPADATVSHDAIETTVGQVLSAGAIPVVLGGDHSITEPSVRACAAAHGPVGMVHFDTHTDTGAEVFGVERSHGTFIRRLIDAGQLDASRYAQIGLRGYWPGEKEFSWQAERGITSLFAHDVRDLGIREVVRRAIAAVGPGPVYLTVDVDVLDPAFIPGTGTPEPGGMTPSELLLGVRTVATDLELVGADVVEVIPTGVGTADASALVAERVVREALTGIALRRQGRAATATRA